MELRTKKNTRFKLMNGITIIIEKGTEIKRNGHYIECSNGMRFFKIGRRYYVSFFNSPTFFEIFPIEGTEFHPKPPFPLSLLN